MVVMSIQATGQSKLLHTYLQLQHQRTGFNGIVLVSKKQQLLYEACIGKASQELDLPVGPHSVFRIASISKQFTALLVALAIEEGRLHSDDSLARYFPSNQHSQWRRITVHQLLSHRSGIPHNEAITDYWRLKSRLPLSKEQSLAEIFSLHLLFEPGTGMKYSSPGYFLLACILESIYKQSYTTILEEKILKPLKLEHTGIADAEKIIPGLVTGYHLAGEKLIPAPYRDPSLMKGSGDLYASGGDLIKWNNSFATDGRWREEMKKKIFTDYSTGSPNYGYGWFLREGGKRTAWYHGGGTFGCSALSAWYPEEQIAIVILSNVSVLPVNELWNDIEKIIFKEPFEWPVMMDQMQMSVENLKAFTGNYKNGQQVLSIMLINDQLYAKTGANPPFEIYPKNNYSFFGKKVNVILDFITGADGNITGVNASLRGSVSHFNKE
jgi:CubicO group peptidase (beta-lactamase class C family)